MNKLTALFLIIVVAGSTFNKAIVLIDYSLNKNFISTALCENRSKPASCCHGKCFLKKQLQKEDSDKGNPGAVKDNVEVLLYCEDPADLHSTVFQSNQIKFRQFNESEFFVALSSIFHPPSSIGLS
ncbi:MAG: hypothetical protein C5B59_12230 [Bacteroidetes bacterium]|nr:MAG: hypothetical protein C5B59_12230 [Bacteroidota bacterium]